MAPVALLLTGCFYVDPILKPSRVVVSPPSATAYRGGILTLAEVYTTDNQPESQRWLVVACARFDDMVPADCDGAEFYHGTDPTAQVPVPVTTLTDPQKLVKAITVQLDARDEHGALASASATYPVADGPPTLELGRSARSYAVGAPIDLFATYGDVDDALDDIVLDWVPTPPATPGAFTLEDLAVPPSLDPAGARSRTVGKRLIAREPGSWDVKVTATDPAQRDPGVPVKPPPVEAHLTFTVAPDRPPCLAQWEPIAPPPGTTLPISAPTVFQVPLVDDDLDAYPAVVGAPEYGTTTFAWSLLPPGAAQRQVLVGATGNRIDFDPGAFTPGDIVELRVEIFDRHHTAPRCDDGAATCSITGSPSCLQRQTWRVEVR